VLLASRFLTFNFFLLFCTKIHHMPNPSAVDFFFLMEFAASNLFDDSPTDRFEIGIQERITIWKNYQLSSFFAQNSPHAQSFCCKIFYGVCSLKSI